MQDRFVSFDASQLRVLVDYGIANQVQGLEAVKVLQLSVQLGNVVVLRIDFLELLELFDSAETRQPVSRQVDCLQVGQLVDVHGDFGEAHAAQVDCALIATLGVSNFQLDFTHSTLLRSAFSYDLFVFGGH